MDKIRIVGGGLAGSILAMQAYLNGFGQIEWWRWGRPSASMVASGIYNPIVLKRLKKVWKADDFTLEAQRFYQVVFQELGWNQSNVPSLYHKIRETGFENDWIAKSGEEAFENFLGKIEMLGGEKLGIVKGAGRLDTPQWLSAVPEFLERKGHTILEKKWEEGSDKGSDIPTVLCQGWKASFTSYGIPPNAFAPVKGEVLRVKLKNYPHAQRIVHGGVFILPLGDGTYKVGATYSWDEFSEELTTKGREWLLAQLDKLWNGEVEVLGQEAAVRPAVKDRKPILGSIPNESKLFVMNGLGSRGTLLAPLLSLWLFDLIRENKPLPKEVDIQRFF